MQRGNLRHGEGGGELQQIRGTREVESGEFFQPADALRDRVRVQV